MKLERAYNHLVCYCQYVTDQADLVFFFDANSEQIKDLAVNKQIRIGGDSRYDYPHSHQSILIFSNRLELDIPELGPMTLGITDVRNESIENEEQMPEGVMHDFDFHCSCEKCANDHDGILGTMQIIFIESSFPFFVEFDLRSAFPDQPKELVYDSFTSALLTQRKFDLRATIIIYNPDKINHRYFSSSTRFERSDDISDTSLSFVMVLAIV